MQFAQRLDGVTGSAIRDIFHIISRPGVISFAGGNPSAASLEPDVIAALANEVLARDGLSILQYGATEGYAPFRESASDFLAGLGVDAPAAQVLPVSGGTQAVDLLCRALVNPGDVVLVEDPTFLGALQAFQIAQTQVMPIPTDDEGIIPAAYEELVKKHSPRFSYLIPTFQNPTGRTLSLARRREVVAIAARHASFILEDDPYRDLRYAGEALPTMKSLDDAGCVLYCTSFSKLVSPGLRIGALVVPDATLLRKLVICKQSSDLHSPTLGQALVDAYLRSGRLPGHIETLRRDYGKQLSAMLDAFAFFPEGVTHTNPEGGFFIWVELPEEVNATMLLPACADKGVAYVPGTHFYCVKDTHANSLRLNFTNAQPETIVRGMRILGDLLKEALS